MTELNWCEDEREDFLNWLDFMEGELCADDIDDDDEPHYA